MVDVASQGRVLAFVSACGATEEDCQQFVTAWRLLSLVGETKVVLAGETVFGAPIDRVRGPLSLGRAELELRAGLADVKASSRLVPEGWARPRPCSSWPTHPGR
jgi:hypothetical protein